MGFDKIFIFVVISLLVCSIVIAEQTIKLPKAPPLEEQVIPEGQNGTLSLTDFTRALVTVYEGTRVDFNIYDPKTRNLVVPNSLLIKEVTKDKVKLLISTDGGEYKEATWNLGDNIEVNYTNNIVPFMFLELQKIRYFEDQGKLIKHATIFFNVPLLQRVNTGNVDTNPNINNVEPVSDVQKNNNLYYYILGLVALLFAGYLFFKKKG